MNTSPVLSPIPEGSIVIEEGPVMDVPETMIEFPRSPVANVVAVTIPAKLPVPALLEAIALST